jgi:hypothetical protein
LGLAGTQVPAMAYEYIRQILNISSQQFAGFINQQMPEILNLERLAIERLRPDIELLFNQTLQQVSPNNRQIMLRALQETPINEQVITLTLADKAQAEQRLLKDALIKFHSYLRLMDDRSRELANPIIPQGDFSLVDMEHNPHTY